LVCWKAKRGNGSELTVHALTKGASPAARDAFVSAVSDFAAALEGASIEGVLPVASIDPLAGAYLGEVAPLGTMADVPLLKWDVGKKLAFLRRLASTLEALHARGLVHGCLRPETVVLDEDLRPVLANASAFDIAEHCKQDRVASQKHRDYAAPSVLDGDKADAFADMYSLGRLLQFMLEGSTPTGFGELVPRLDCLSQLPPGLVRIVRRATVLDAAQRYPSMDELLEDLDRYDRDETVGMDHPGVDDIARYAATGKHLRKPTKAEATAKKRPSKGPRARAVTRALSPRAKAAVRTGGLALLGLGAIGAGMFGAYDSGVDQPLWTGIAMLGALIVGFALPSFGTRKALGRVFLVVLCLSAVFLADVTRRAAAVGAARSGLSSDTLAARLDAFRALKRDGKRDFSGANLAGADLTGIDLQECVLDSANLEGTILRGANLQRASFVNTRATGANLSGADLAGVNADFIVGWLLTECDSTTHMPNGWTCTDGKPAKTAAPSEEGAVQ
jgi:hypothetical protein